MGSLIDELYECSISLVEKSLDDDFSDKEQDQFLKKAEEVREKALKLHRLRFTKDTDHYKDAMSQIRQINKDLQKSIEEIDDFVDFFDDLTKLVGYLDKLISVIVKL